MCLHYVAETPAAAKTRKRANKTAATANKPQKKTDTATPGVVDGPLRAVGDTKIYHRAGMSMSRDA